MRETIATPRLTLRPLAASDVAAVVRLAGDWDVARMCARVPHPYGPADARDWLARASAGWAQRREYSFAISTPGDGVVGAVGLGARGAGDRLTLGYWIGKPFWAKGFATEAAGALLAAAQADLARLPVVAEHFVDNPKSGRVLEKLGFAYTGETRLMLCLARLDQVLARTMLFTPPMEAAA